MGLDNYLDEHPPAERQCRCKIGALPEQATKDILRLREMRQTNSRITLHYACRYLLSEYGLTCRPADIQYHLRSCMQAGGWRDVP